ncbi:MAG: SixA phosphatase family protein [Acidimicrobiia bacterium]
MKHLYLLRHAKSDWSEPLPDPERPLTARGHRSGALIASYLRAESISPALVLCSSALRTRETLAHLLPVLGEGTTISVERDLYGAGASDLRTRLRDIDDAVPSVMLISHNPGTEELALELVGSGDADAHARMESKFPTAGLALLVLLDDSWRDLGPGRARLTGFVVPRELEGSTYDRSP